MRVFNLFLKGAFAAVLTFAAIAGLARFDTLAQTAGQSPAWKTGTAPVPAAQTGPAPAAVPAAVPVAPPPAAAPAKKKAAPANAKKTVANDAFGAVKLPASTLAAKSIGFYAKGCLAGGKPLPVNGPAWQVMRLSRNRMWGHPTLIAYIERLAQDAKEKDGWPGLLVGDLSMPRGGPMPWGHASHQVGLDVDIWYKPAPDHELTAKERDELPMQSFLLDPGHVNPAMWSPDYEKLLRRAVSYPEVARAFVNPAIKKWLCDNVKGDRSFLHKINPILGHDSHFHVRLRCPAGQPGCENQQPVNPDEGCGKTLDKWIEALMKSPPGKPAPQPSQPSLMTRLVRRLTASKDKDKAKAASAQKHRMTLDQLPAECEAVLRAPVPAVPVAAMQ